MITLHAECVINGQNELGEGPVWDDRLGELFWVDIEGLKLHRYKPSDSKQQEYKLEQKAGSAVPAQDGSWILALQDGFYRFDLATGQSELLIHTPDGKQGNRLNDGKCDSSGRFWAGTMSAKWQKDGTLYTLETGNALTPRHPGVVCSNGLAWSSDGKLMYYIDSGEALVNVFDYDAATGEITNKRTAITYPEGQGGPDGMSIDTEDMLWIGHWGGWQVSRWNPRTGEKLVTVEVPVKNVTSCAFGGENLDELYITTTRVGNTEDELKDQPNAGGLFRVKPGVKGLPVARAKV